MLDGVELIGTGTVADRIWARPAVTVLGIDCPPVVGATPSVQASARALVSLRVPPGMDAAEATEAAGRAPRGARAVGRAGRAPSRSARASRSAPTPPAPRTRRWPRPCAIAYPGQEMQSAGMGGSIPLCNTLASLYPEAEILLIGLSEPEAQIHAVNESVSPRGAGAAVGRRGAVPAELRGELTPRARASSPRRVQRQAPSRPSSPRRDAGRGVAALGAAAVTPVRPRTRHRAGAVAAAGRAGRQPSGTPASR